MGLPSVEHVGYLASSPGDDFIAIVEANSQELAEGRLKHPESVTKQYADLLTWIDEIPHHDSYANPFDLDAALGIILSYALRQLTLPLVRERLETDHAAFTSSERSFGLFIKLAEANQGFPGVLVTQQGITFSPSMSLQVRAAWCLCAVLGDIVRQLINAEGLILCPKKHRRVQGFQFINHAAPASDCAREIELGCGSIYQGRYALPACGFSTVLKGLGMLQ